MQDQIMNSHENVNASAGNESVAEEGGDDQEAAQEVKEPCIPEENWVL